MSLGLLKIWQLVSILKNRLQARTAANFKLRITLLAAFSLLNVVLGGMLYKWTSAEDSWSAALFQVYAVLYSIPGADITHAPTKGGTVVLNCIFIFGLLVFATILAMITEEVNTFLMAARSGRAPLVMSGHILLLNWNEQVPFLLDQFEAVQHSVSGAGGGAHKLSGRPLVILADKDKEDMDALVVGFMRKHKLEVHTRSGKPYKLEHLERVSASVAAAVLVLHPEAAASTCATATGAADTAAAEGCGGSSVQGSGAGGATGGSGSSSGGMGVRTGADDGAAALKLQTVMALTAQLMGRKAAVVVQVPESDSCTAGGRRSCQWEMLDNVLAGSGHDVGLMELPVKRMVNSLAVQAALQPWSASIYTQLMQHGRQPDLTFHQLPQSLFTKPSRSFKPLGLSGSSGGSSSSSRHSADYGLTSSFSLRSSSTVFKRPGSMLAAGQPGKGAGLRPSMSYNPGLSSTSAGGAAPAASAAAVPEGAMLYDDVRVRYEGRGNIVLGYYRVSDQELVLNPGKGSWCEAGDVLVALTRSAGHTTSVFAKFWQPLLSSISSSSSAQQQLQQQGAAKAVAATAAVAAVAGTTAAAAAAASRSPTSSQHNSSKAGRTKQQEQPSPTEQQQQQQHSPRQPGLRHSRPSLAPIAETTDDAGQQQQQQSQQLSGTSQTQPNPQDSTAHQQQEVTGQGTHQQQQHTQQAVEQCFASQLVDDDASHFASPFAAATASTAAVHEDCLVCESEPLLTAPAPAAASCSSAGDSEHHLDAHHSQPSGLGDPCVSVSGPPGLRSAPSWLFSARKVLRQQDQQLATQRLSRMKGSLGGSGVSSNERTRSRHDWGDQERYVVVAGFTAAECGRDLLPHFLDFAPADSRVVFAVGPFEEPPPELDYEGTVEEEEDREGQTPILHRVHYRFIQVAYPTSAEGLQAAGVLEADALLLGPEEGVRDSSAEADAQVLGSMVELQHLLSHSDRYQRTHSGPFRALSGSSKPSERKSSWGRKRTSFKHTASRNISSHEGSLSGTAVEAAAAAAALAAAPNNTAAGGAAEGTADNRDASASMQAGSLRGSQLSAHAVQQHRSGLQQPWPNMAQHAGNQQQSPLHVVACVTTTASKAVAAAFFGAMGPDTAASAVSSRGLKQGSGSVVGACEFTYELIVPGEVESAVLVQVAGEPLYTRVIHELLGTSEGCELYLLPPGAFGCISGEVLRFAELQAVGHLVNRTVIGVVAGGRVILAPGREWRWHVQDSDKVAVLALSWDC